MPRKRERKSYDIFPYSTRKYKERHIFKSKILDPPNLQIFFTQFPLLKVPKKKKPPSPWKRLIDPSNFFYQIVGEKLNILLIPQAEDSSRGSF